MGVTRVQLERVPMVVPARKATVADAPATRAQRSLKAPRDSSARKAGASRGSAPERLIQVMGFSGETVPASPSFAAEVAPLPACENLLKEATAVAGTSSAEAKKAAQLRVTKNYKLATVQTNSKGPNNR